MTEQDVEKVGQHDDLKLDKHGKGRWTVPVKETNFGLRVDHGLSDRVMVMGLPKSAGWRAISSVCLPHQTYLKKIEPWIADHPHAREVAILEVDSGTWKTVWETGWPSMQRAEWLPKDHTGCPECRVAVPEDGDPCRDCLTSEPEVRTDGGREQSGDRVCRHLGCDLPQEYPGGPSEYCIDHSLSLYHHWRLLAEFGPINPRWSA